jgi:hypothetical protein
MALTSYTPADAHWAIVDLQHALSACSSFKGQVSQISYSHPTVRPLSALDDEAVSYQLTQSVLDGGKTTRVPLAFILVRCGSTIAAFYTSNALADTVPTVVPTDVVTPQMQKLTTR